MADETITPVAHGEDWLSQAELRALTPAALAERTSALRPLLAANAAGAERLRRPVDAVWDALRASGIFYHFVPRAYGGLEFGLQAFIDAILPLAKGCASTAWVAAFCVEHNWLLAQFPKEGQDEIFGAFPYVIAPAVTTPPGVALAVDGGYRLNGRWRWGTGVTHADWAMLAAVAPGEAEGPRPLFCIAPIAEVVIVDTWRVDGMIATGSHDIEAKDVFVPARRAASLEAIGSGRGVGAQLYDNPLYRMPMLPFLALTAAIAAVGTALAAVEHYHALMTARAVYGSPAKHLERPAAQMRLAQADVISRAAEQQLRGAAARIEALSQSGEKATIEQRTRLRADIAYAVELSRQAISTLAVAAGSSAHSLDNPLQRALRDINTMATHIVFDPDAAAESLGRAMFGLPPNSPLV